MHQNPAAEQEMPITVLWAFDAFRPTKGSVEITFIVVRSGPKPFPDQFDASHRSVVALTRTELEDADVTTRASFVTRCDIGEQLDAISLSPMNDTT